MRCKVTTQQDVLFRCPDAHKSETSIREMTMSISRSVATIAVATTMFGSAVRTATAGNRDMSRAVGVCEDTRVRRVATVASSDKEDVVQRRAATFTATRKGGRSNDAVREGEAVVTELGVNASAVTYWVSESDGWLVVTTVDIRLHEDQDNDTKKQTVVRFSAVLLPGQLERISVPVAIGERQQVLRIRRLGDRLEVARVFGPSV
jgi:hypothetical protein